MYIVSRFVSQSVVRGLFGMPSPQHTRIYTCSHSWYNMNVSQLKLPPCWNAPASPTLPSNEIARPLFKRPVDRSPLDHIFLVHDPNIDGSTLFTRPIIRGPCRRSSPGNPEAYFSRPLVRDHCICREKQDDDPPGDKPRSTNLPLSSSFHWHNRGGNRLISSPRRCKTVSTHNTGMTTWTVYNRFWSMHPNFQLWRDGILISTILIV